MTISTKNFIFGIVITLVGCDILSITMPTPVTTPESLTSISPYVHYSSPEELDIHLAFGYPEYWIFRYTEQYVDYIIIGLVDPRFLTVPTRAPDESHGTPDDFPKVSIWIKTVNSNQSLDSHVEPYRHGTDNPPWTILLNKYRITVDGYDAIVIEYQANDPEIYTSVMFRRTVFFIVEDKLYSIGFTIAEHERGGEFEQGYEYFFDSLTITP